MVQYVSLVENLSCLEEQILSNRAEWAQFVHRYNTVGTHFFVCKLEVWFADFCVAVLGLENVCGSNEFGKTRGAIHTHILVHNSFEADSLIGTVMVEWALTDMQHM
jgi:hypothetical protein